MKVLGAVNAPGSLLWRRGAGIGYYISAAGGLAANGDGGRVSVRFANGDARTRTKWLLFSSAPIPGPGSEVFVPARPPGDKTNVVAMLGSIAQVVSSFLAIYVVLRR